MVNNGHSLNLTLAFRNAIPLGIVCIWLMKSCSCLSVGSVAVVWYQLGNLHLEAAGVTARTATARLAQGSGLLLWCFSVAIWNRQGLAWQSQRNAHLHLGKERCKREWGSQEPSEPPEGGSLLVALEKQQIWGGETVEEKIREWLVVFSISVVL